MHPEPEIVEVKLGKVIPVDAVRIEIVFFQAASKTAALLVFAPEITKPEKDPGSDDGGDYIDREIAAESG
jgi:hypothetical protein